MTNNNLTTNTKRNASLIKLMLIGAGINLIIIGLFLSGVNNPRPEWGSLWMVRPLLIVPFAGAMVGVFHYYMAEYRIEGSWKKVFANLLSLFAFIIALWLGSVLGLAGTLWN